MIPVQGFDDQTTAATSIITCPNTSHTSLVFTQKHVFSLKNNILAGITFKPWMKILTRNIFHIEVKYYFRASFITLLSMVNSVLAFIEDIYYPKPLIDSVQLPDDPVFIIGHPRTGTTLIHNLLASDTDHFYYCDTFAAGFSAAFLWMDKYKYYFSGVIDKTRPMDSMPLTFELPGEDELATNTLSAGYSYYQPLIFMRQEPSYRKYIDFNSELGATSTDELLWSGSFLFLLKKLTLREQRVNPTNHRKLLLKSPVHTGRVPLLRKLFPKARFVYTHRHPEVVFQSAAHMADTTYWYCYLNTPSTEQIVEFILWQFEYLWKVYDKAVCVSSNGNGRRQVSEDVIEVSYESLITDSVTTLQEIYAHVGVKFKAGHYREQLEALASYKVNTHTQLPTEISSLLRTRWRGYFDAFGYS